MHPIIASAPLTAPDAVVAIPGDARDKYPTRVECDGVDGGLGSGIGQQDRDEKRGQDGMISLPPGACPGGGAVRAAGLDGGRRSGLGPEGRVENPRQDTMMSLPPGACPGGGAARPASMAGRMRSGSGPEARVENPRQDTMNRETVRSVGVGAGQVSVPGRSQAGTLGQRARSEIRRLDPMNRETVRLDGAGVGEVSVVGVRPAGTLGQGARSEIRRLDPMNRETVRSVGVVTGEVSVVGVRQAGIPGQGARSEIRRLDPMNRETVRAASVAGGVRSGLGPEPRVENPRQDTMNRGAVWAAGSAGEMRSSSGPKPRVENPRPDPMNSLPPGAYPGGGTVGATGAGGSQDRAVRRGIAGISPAVDCPRLGTIDCGTARRRGRQPRMLRRTLLAAVVPAALAAPALSVPAWATPGSFDAFLLMMRAEARRAGIAAGTLDRAFAGLTPNQGVIDRDRHQPEFTLTWARYRALVISDQRIANGRAALQKNRPLLGRIQERYGVSPGVITGIWGLESSFGTELGSFHVVQALATLAWEGRRAAFFRTELLAALRILDHGDVSPARMTGSYAGAMGQPQFMPSAYLRYAVDFEGNGRRDIWTSTPDTLASIACYLADSGWRPGGSWGQKVTLPADFPTAESGRAIRKPVGEWLRRGVGSADGRRLAPPEADAALILPDGPGGEAFLAYGNFAAIRRYNPSDFYAIAVGLIGDGITL
jgi:membrane-bound lytic murein transglycosylase B